MCHDWLSAKLCDLACSISWKSPMSNMSHMSLFKCKYIWPSKYAGSIRWRWPVRLNPAVENRRPHMFEAVIMNWQSIYLYWEDVCVVHMRFSTRFAKGKLSVLENVDVEPPPAARGGFLRRCRIDLFSAVLSDSFIMDWTFTTAV